MNGILNSFTSLLSLSSLRMPPALDPNMLELQSFFEDAANKFQINLSSDRIIAKPGRIKSPERLPGEPKWVHEFVLINHSTGVPHCEVKILKSSVKDRYRTHSEYQFYLIPYTKNDLPFVEDLSSRLSMKIRSRSVHNTSRDEYESMINRGLHNLKMDINFLNFTVFIVLGVGTYITNVIREVNLERDARDAKKEFSKKLSEVNFPKSNFRDKKTNHGENNSTQMEIAPQYTDLLGIKLDTRLKGTTYNLIDYPNSHLVPDKYYSINSTPFSTELHQKITKYLLENNEFLRKSLKGKKISFLFNDDLDREVSEMESKDEDPTVKTLGFSICESAKTNGENRIYIDIKSLDDRPELLMITLHELYHIAFHSDVDKLSYAHEERNAIYFSVAFLLGNQPDWLTNDEKKHLDDILLEERIRSEDLPNEYYEK